jgi:signal transduction histidine kinase
VHSGRLVADNGLLPEGVRVSVARAAVAPADSAVPAIGGVISGRRWRIVAGGAAGLAWGLTLSAIIVAALSGVVSRVFWPDFAVGLAYPAVALLVVRARAAWAWASLMLLSGVFSAANVASTSWADRVYFAHLGPATGAAWAAWTASWTWVVSIVGFCAVAFFPDGRLPSPRWRLAPTALVAAGLLIVVEAMLARVVDGYGVANPLPVAHVDLAAPPGVQLVIALAGVAGCLGCLAASVVKFRRGDAVARRQIGWYGYGFAVAVGVLVVAVATDVPAPFLVLGPAAVAAGAAIAILKYRLYDIDLIVNRTLAWGLLTGLVVALYVICVGFFQRLYAGGGTAGALLATGVVAVAFQPLRARVQRTVNRLVYGYRDQPEVVLRELARSLDASVAPDDVLLTLAGTLARTLRLSTVVLEVDGGPDLSAVYGDSKPGLLEAARAENGGTLVRILAAPRGAAGALAARDRQLLADLGPSLAATAEALRLRRALESSRLRAVAALAEAQRRMRRDLHDGLGPVLAGLRLTIGTARRLIDSAPEEAQRILADAQGDAQAAVEDVRRLAHDLRPPALDELGLAAALRDRLERILGDGCRLDFTAVNVPEQLPAAVEVAAYRIGCEAVLNVTRHAQAGRCEVSLCTADDGLWLTVLDDGIGPQPGVSGVGLRSVRERAEELGGAVTVDGQPGAGTAVRVWLPLADPDGSPS